MATNDPNKSDSFETKLQLDPMLRTGLANRAWVWAIAGAVVIIVIITFVGLLSSNQ